MKFKELKVGDIFRFANDEEIFIKVNKIDNFFDTVSLDGGYYCDSWGNEEVIKIDKKVLDNLRK